MVLSRTHTHIGKAIVKNYCIQSNKLNRRFWKGHPFPQPRKRWPDNTMVIVTIGKWASWNNVGRGNTMVIVTIGKRASWNNARRGPGNVFVLKYRISLLGAERGHKKKLRIHTSINRGIMVVLKYRSSLLGAERDHKKKTTNSYVYQPRNYGRVKISNFFAKGWNSFVGRTHNVHSNHRKKYYIGKVLVGRTHNVYSNHCKKH